MNFENEFLSTLIIGSTCEYIAFLSCPYLWSYRVYRSLFGKRLECKRIITMVGKSVSVIYNNIREVLRCDIHLAFRNRDISPAFASSLMDLEVFPDRSLAICVINGVGTTKWFLLPVST